MKKTQPKTKSNSAHIRYQVLELPSNSADMERFVEENRTRINEKIVDTIDYAIRKKLGVVELFCFKNSRFVVVLNQRDYMENLNNIFKYSLDNEQFEVCEKVKKIRDKLEKISHIFTYKKIK